ncbi:hypothetical protein B0T16DRAFT_414441 [Cercophora newfieldiana]|uniref:Uncharacterized protein n=1 Tax=Cercophora newfieldiana TaxID=92897 RepID=A0AA39Y6E5_9PEZI|nr:hypothetical protein B0T16DRAFT_414441 [Cercophora newfieldiana]
MSILGVTRQFSLYYPRLARLAPFHHLFGSRGTIGKPRRHLRADPLARVSTQPAASHFDPRYFGNRGLGLRSPAADRKLAPASSLPWRMSSTPSVSGVAWREVTMSATGRGAQPHHMQ